MRIRFRTASLAALVAAGSLAAAPLAATADQARDDDRLAQAAQAAQGDAQFSDGDLENFIEAARDLSQIQQDYQPRVQAAGDDQQAAELQSQANAEMVQAIQESGLTVQTYQQIYARLQEDNGSRERVRDLAGQPAQ